MDRKVSTHTHTQKGNGKKDTHTHTPLTEQDQRHISFQAMQGIENLASSFCLPEITPHNILFLHSPHTCVCTGNVKKYYPCQCHTQVVLANFTHTHILPHDRTKGVWVEKGVKGVCAGVSMSSMCKAPEVMKGEKWGYQACIYSLGACLLMCVGGKEGIKGWTRTGREFVRRMTTTDPDSRPCSAELKADLAW
jgi:hypothetical protein